MDKSRVKQRYKVKKFQIRLSENEFELLCEMSKKAGMSKAEFIRHFILSSAQKETKKPISKD